MTTTKKIPSGNDYGTPVSVVVAETISESTEREITDFSLYESIDTDALNKLFSGDQSKDGDIRAMIDVMELTVVVERVGGEITVRVNE